MHPNPYRPRPVIIITSNPLYPPFCGSVVPHLNPEEYQKARLPVKKTVILDPGKEEAATLLHKAAERDEELFYHKHTLEIYEVATRAETGAGV